MPKLATKPSSTRLPEWLKEELEEEFERSGETRSEGLRRALEEWWALRHFEHIEFRDGLWGRRAALSGGPEVWEVVSVADTYGSDIDGIAEHFGWLDRTALEEALEYYGCFPDRVRERIEENRRYRDRLAEHRAS